MGVNAEAVVLGDSFKEDSFDPSAFPLFSFSLSAFSLASRSFVGSTVEEVCVSSTRSEVSGALFAEAVGLGSIGLGGAVSFGEGAEDLVVEVVVVANTGTATAFVRAAHPKH